MRTNAEQGNGGSISVRSSRVMLTQAQIVTSVTGEPTASGGLAAFGNGGDIRIDADALVLNTGFIQANTAATNAAGGLVHLNLKTLVASGNSLFVGGQLPYFFAPGVFGFNVIQAAAPTGVSGAVEITSPVLDLSGSLGRLTAQVADAAPLGRTPCQTTGGSSLAQVGQGRLPVSYRGLLGAPVSPPPAAVRPPGALLGPDLPLTQLAMLATGCQ